jgi:hypothetical protein
MMCSLARLEPKTLKAVQSLEKELGKPLLAFSCHDLRAAELKDDQLARITKLESELNVYVVAVQGR